MKASLPFEGKRLGLIGAGNMAEAIVRGVIEAKLVPTPNIVASDPSAERRRAFEEIGVSATDDNGHVLAESDVVVLAVKPQVLADVLGGLAGHAEPRHVFISICAGVTTSRIEGDLPDGTRVIRVMPNTPMLVGEGAVGLSRGANASAGDLDLACTLFRAAAKVVIAVDDEALLDPVTALSGSGPAYVFYLVERMVAAAVAEGLDGADALRLAIQTVAGAAALMDSSGESPAELRRRVTSPGGTTQAAIEWMDSHEVGAGIEGAVRRAAERSRELGEG